MADISTYYPRIIGRELGLSPDTISPLLESTRLTGNDIYLKSSLPYSDFSIFLETALKYSQDPALGLRFGRHASLFGGGDLSVAAMAAPNLLEVLRVFSRFSQLQASFVGIDTQQDLEVLRIRGQDLSEMGSTRRTQHEVLVLTLQNSIEIILGRPFTEGRYYLSYPEPEYADQYSPLLHANFEFNAPLTGLDIPLALLDTPSPFYNEELWLKAQLRCAQLMDELRDSQVNIYNSQVLALLRSHQPPLPSIKTVAHELHVSERTLHRRLQEEGKAFRLLQNTVMQEWACRYLSESNLSVEAIAVQLGYQDSANFRRAFKRWQGCSPQTYRQGS